jgi:hypothetical protein
LELFDVAIYKPENCRGFAQKLLVGIALMQIKRFKSFMEHQDTTLQAPESIFIYVQGNPGTGKTFVSRTILNIVRQCFKGMGFDLAIAPTGVAADLLKGKTHELSLGILCKLRGYVKYVMNVLKKWSIFGRTYFE